MKLIRNFTVKVFIFCGYFGFSLIDVTVEKKFYKGREFSFWLLSILLILAWTWGRIILKTRSMNINSGPL